CPKQIGGSAVLTEVGRTEARNVTQVRNGGPRAPRPSPLVYHRLAFDLLLASPRPSEPLTDRGFASLSCPWYRFRLFGHSLIRYSLLPHPFGSVTTAIMSRDVYEPNTGGGRSPNLLHPAQVSHLLLGFGAFSAAHSLSSGFPTLGAPHACRVDASRVRRNPLRREHRRKHRLPDECPHHLHYRLHHPD